MSSQLSILYTTFGSKEDAIRVPRDLLERHLIACANILEGMHSLYLWEEKLEENRETAVLLKTTPEKIPELMTTLQKLHPYETPALLEIPLNHTNAPFANWVQNCVR